MDLCVRNRRRGYLYAAAIGLAAAVRFWKLDAIPPGLWYDEALYCLNALSIAPGHWPIFFMLDGHPVEPLYVYSLAVAFALAGSDVLVARAVSAVWGTLAVTLFYPLARRFVGPRWALVGCFVYAVFRWPVHFSRTIFRAATPPVLLMLVVIFFMRWREQRRRADAFWCGVFLGLGFYTYIAFRLVPLFLLGWIAWLMWKREIVWRRDAKALAVMLFAAACTFAPLALDFLRHPEHFSERLEEVTMFHRRVEQVNSDGTKLVRLERKPAAEILKGLAKNAVAVAGMWTWRGDHVARHNLPNEPIFDPISGLVFYVGVLYALATATSREHAFVPLWWLAVLSLASICSFGAPNILRMQGAIPAVILLYVLGLRWLYRGLAPRVPPSWRQIVVAALLVWFACWQLDSYFRRFALSPQVRTEFLADTFYEPARAVRRVAPEVGEVWTSRDLFDHLTFHFVTSGVPNIRPFARLADVPTTSLQRRALLLSQYWWQEEMRRGTDPRQELVRLGARPLREFSVPVPQAPPGQEPRLPWATLWVLPASSATAQTRPR